MTASTRPCLRHGLPDCVLERGEAVDSKAATCPRIRISRLPFISASNCRFPPGPTLHRFVYLPPQTLTLSFSSAFSPSFALAFAAFLFLSPHTHAQPSYASFFLMLQFNMVEHHCGTFAQVRSQIFH